MDKGGYTPHEPFRSHQDWEGSLSSVVEPAPLHEGLQARLAHLPRALIPVPDTAVSAAGLTSPARSAMLGIRQADALFKVEHEQDLFAVRIGSPRVALAGSHPLTMPDVARPHHPSYRHR